MKKQYLDQDEKDLMESIERGEWKSVKGLQSQIAKHQKTAQDTLRKDKRLNIRISSKDLEAIRAMAVETGIPYQTLISSVLHRFVSGRLKEA